MEYNNRLYHAGGEPPDINDGANLGDRVVNSDVDNSHQYMDI